MNDLAEKLGEREYGESVCVSMMAVVVWGGYCEREVEEGVDIVRRWAWFLAVWLGGACGRL